MSQEELEQIIYAYGKDLFSFCVSITRSHQEAEDLYQDTFLKLYEIGQNLYIEKNPKSFLMGISINIYRNYKRKWSIRQKIIGVEFSIENMNTDIPANAQMTEEQILMQEECRRLHSAVKKLPDKYKIPILLFYMEEFSIIEIANILKLPKGTIKSRLYRAKKILKQKLEEA